MRLRRNCTNQDDFVQEASILRERFLEKGYDDNELEVAFRSALDRNKDDLLIPKLRSQDDSLKFSFVTTYSNQHYEIKKIMQRHSKVLQGDRVLGSNLPDMPRIVHRGVPPLKLQIAPNVVDPPKQLSFFQNMGSFFPCRKCPICKLNTESFQSTSTKETSTIKPFIICSTKNVVYLARCPCGLQYIGLYLSCRLDWANTLRI